MTNDSAAEVDNNSNNRKFLLTDHTSLFGKFVDHSIQVAIKNSNIVHAGECFTVDPDSQTIVLLERFLEEEADKWRLRFIAGNSVERISILSVPLQPLDGLKKYKRQLHKVLYEGVSSDSSFSKEQLCAKKKALLKWFTENRIPASERDHGHISILNGMVTVEPPYTVTQVRSSNTMVLDRVMRLIDSCPEG